MTSMFVVMTILACSFFAWGNSLQSIISSQQIDLNNIQNLNTEHATQVYQYNQTITILQTQIANKTDDYNQLLEAFATYCNLTYINIESNWTQKDMQQVTFSNRAQPLYLFSYVNGTHVALRLFFEEQKIWSQPVLAGTYKQCGL